MISKNEIKLIRSLDAKKYRKKYNLFVVEGERTITDAISFSAQVKEVFISESYIEKKKDSNLLDLTARAAIPSKIISDKELKSISGAVTPSGVLAVCKIPDEKSIQQINKANVLYLASIQDPGNLGTLLRSAAWFGVNNVVLSADSIDPYNSKAVRGGMGSHFHLNIYSNISISSFPKHYKIGAFMDGENINEAKIDRKVPWVLVIGNEPNGISSGTAKYIDKKIAIPLLGKGESLNAGVAGSILLYSLTVPLLYSK